MNTKYGRLKDGRIEYAPASLETEDGVKMNPSAASYLAAGWKKVVDERPEPEPGWRMEISGWREDAETLKCYPYKYELYMCFELDGNTLTVTHTVKNPNEKDMYFSLGAHPAFNCETGDKIIFEKKETAYCERIDRDSILLEEKELILDNSDTITIEKDTFDKDVMIFSGLNSKRVTLESAHSQRKISFEFCDAPFFSVWAKPDAPFVCLEPWYGINDSYEKMPDFAHKRGNVRLEAGGEFSFRWRATFRQELTNPNR